MHELDVGPTAIKVLLVLDGILNDKLLASVGEVFVKLRSHTVELGVLGGLHSLVGSVGKELACRVLPLTHLASWLPGGGHGPSVAPSIVVEVFLLCWGQGGNRKKWLDAGEG